MNRHRCRTAEIDPGRKEIDLPAVLDLSALLPESLEELDIECHPIQFKVFDEHFRSVLHDVEPGASFPEFPKLMRITMSYEKLSTNEANNEAYWQRDAGLIGDYNRDEHGPPSPEDLPRSGGWREIVDAVETWAEEEMNEVHKDAL
jgi:hypothetical protein